MNRTVISRRTFAAAGAASLAACQSRPPAVTRKLRLALIGVNNQAGSHYDMAAREDVVALVDADARMFDKPFYNWQGDAIVRPSPRECFPAATRLDDFRELFERPDSFDAVVISTPDHVHFNAAARALELGKPVFCEKPLTWGVAESQELMRLAQAGQVATQLGAQGLYFEPWRKARALYRAGAIGQVRKVVVWVPTNASRYGVPGRARPPGENPTPPGFNWDLWLGPAPARPYVEGAYHPLMWRQVADFGGGTLSDWCCHKLIPVFKILEPKYPNAIEIERPVDWNGESWPDRRRIKFSFPAIAGRDGFELIWIDGDGARPEPSDLPHWPQGEDFTAHGMVMVGDAGSIHFLQSHLQDLRLLPADLATRLGPIAAQPVQSSMHDDFLAAAKGEIAWTAPEGHFMFGGLMTAASLLGNAAQFDSDRKIVVDPETGAVANAEPAVAAYIRRSPRPGWRAV
jgi:Oxidoreductase family, NAD-binding Rossmann fold/Oxidoreductase family, C-terminal alpha/beta domain